MLVRLYLLLLMAALPFLCMGNAAMPGFFNVGAGHRLMPLSPADSAAATHVQMSKELVVMQLYKGFAGVRGEYWFYNNSDTAITITMGYPEGAEFEQPNVEYVVTDSLYHVQIYINDQPTDTGYIPAMAHDAHWKNIYHMGDGGWITWQVTFPPKDTTKVRVYYMLNTNWAQLRLGYDREHTCGAAYVLQSGGPWAGTIGEGRIVLELKQGLKPDYMIGLAPVKRFKHNSKGLFVWDFTDLEPTAKDNVIIRYYTRDSDFNFIKANKAYATVFERLDSLSERQAALQTAGWDTFERAEFKPAEKTQYIITGVLVVFAASVIGLVVGAIWLIKKFSRKRRKA